MRHQQFKWVNGIKYYFGANDCQSIIISVVTCSEEWEEVSKKNAERETIRSRHAWISSRPLNACNLHDRCNFAARYRWGIEVCILVEKYQSYHYEHCFALDWQAMKGYLYLMLLAHVFNTLIRFSSVLSTYFQQFGVRGFITFVYNAFTDPWLNPEVVEVRLSRPLQLCFE